MAQCCAKAALGPGQGAGRERVGRCCAPAVPGAGQGVERSPLLYPAPDVT